MPHRNRHFDEWIDAQLNASTRRPDACVAAAFGIALRAARERRRMPTDQLADRAGFDRMYVSMIDRGVREPTLADFLRLSIAVGVSPTRLLEDTIGASSGQTFGRTDLLRVREVWIAFANALALHPQGARMLGGSLGSCLLDELARHGLTIVPLPEPPEGHGHA